MIDIWIALPCIYIQPFVLSRNIFIFLIYLQFTSWSFCCSNKWISPVWDTHSSSPLSPSSAHRGSPAFSLILQDLCLTLFGLSRWLLLLLYFFGYLFNLLIAKVKENDEKISRRVILSDQESNPHIQEAEDFPFCRFD